MAGGAALEIVCVNVTGVMRNGIGRCGHYRRTLRILELCSFVNAKKVHVLASGAQGGGKEE